MSTHQPSPVDFSGYSDIQIGLECIALAGGGVSPESVRKALERYDVHSTEIVLAAVHQALAAEMDCVEKVALIQDVIIAAVIKIKDNNMALMAKAA